MHSRMTRMPRYAAGMLALLTATLAGCGAHSAAGGKAAPVSPQDAVRLAAKTSNAAKSFTGTLALKVTAKPGASGIGNFSMDAKLAERLHPSLLARIDIGKFSAQGMSLPGGMGGMSEIVTPKAFYMKWSLFSTMLHTTKPWIEIPLSAMNKASGLNITQLFNQTSSNSPLAQSGMLAGATHVRRVGSTTINGIPVTGYAGTVSLSKGLAFLKADVRAKVRQQIAAAGFRTARFTEWIDGQHIARKAVIIEDGTSIRETITVTITSVNQPVSIQVPNASQIAPLPKAS